ncbi:PIR Superfamily Protein [Plasmodium ovale wallikeri]|uniref:PIR Superfamily Protein n=1 Tax=Plasmodium ovale wallikeri TaxID=864142 RepID=A0A1A8YM51_PLAOA|nr:PIR Superfamily Protein [Plasmodium ovale wallikeri]SBT55319.1 PIR Superfamily Protein [Plasmodium ovale wallikeri]
MAQKDPFKALRRLFGFSSSELFSQRFYDDLNYNSFYLPDYRDLCKKVKDYKGTINNRRICERVLKYLKTKSIASPDGKYEYDDCILLNYWLYGELVKIFGKDNISQIASAFGNLQVIWNELIEDPKNDSYYRKCKPNSNIVNYNDWEKRKELYDYYVDYGTIFGTGDFYEAKCKEYYEYIEKKQSLYDHFDRVCPNTKHCPELYEKWSLYNPKLVLSELSCHGQIQRERENEKARQRALKQDRESQSSDTEMTQGDSQIGTKIGTSFIGIVPALLTASVLYKFTPIGTMFGNHGVNNQNFINNVDGVEFDGFLSHAQESGDMFSGGGENYISYQPM